MSVYKTKQNIQSLRNYGPHENWF